MSDYQVAKGVSSEAAAALSHLDPLTQQLLVNRGITTKAEADSFLNPSYEEEQHDPFLLHDMDKAVVRILRAMDAGERIAIFSDYDCDGIPAAVVLHDFFVAVGHENFTNYIPHRHYEGFGLSSTAVNKLHAEKVDLIITLDCGTSDHEAVSQANRHGIDVIITDHHEPKDTLPEAVAVVNPKVGESYPFAGLCGAGVIYKVVQALIQKGKENKQFSLIDGWEKWWLDMVGIATIADMVPLTGENRVYARYGLDVLRKSRRPGLQQLLRKQRASQRHLTEDDIGFTIGPRINAASRMDNPEYAFAMLSATTEEEAGATVAHLEKLNNERKGMVAAMTKDIHKRLDVEAGVPEVLVMGHPEWRPSLVGLAANKLAEEHNCPVFLWGRDGNGVIKGSCRSDGSTSLVCLMDEVKDAFLEYGGHHFSGGFSVSEQSIHHLPERLCEAFRTLGNEAAVSEVLQVDAEVLLDQINRDFIQSLQQLSPYGAENPKPLFLFRDVTPAAVEHFGKVKDHTKLQLTTSGMAREAIAFFRLPSQFTKEPIAGESVSLLAHVEQSFFMGRLQTRLRIVDVL
ncbi:single-stranded-DNA-specific exonuclease RecJ [Candidatus Pacebacteria bacterium]|nr:single-stranded-DNA-specific exonuclease RecJ [Candidatus Paceibacterota bacterium]